MFPGENRKDGNMKEVLSITGLFFLSGGFLLLLGQAVSCYRLGFTRAGTVSVLLSLLISAGFFFPPVAVAAGSAGILFCLLLLIPLKRTECSQEWGTRYDERDIPFSRQRLKPGTDQYRAYYQKHPEKEKRDAATRALPGLTSEGSMFYSTLNCAAINGNFEYIHALHSNTSGEPAEERADVLPGGIQIYVRKLLEYQGFKCIGFTEVKPEHYYSHFGRRPDNYGEEVPVEHKSAIVIGSKMKERFTGTAPLSAEVVEVSLRYADSAAAAVKTAALLRNLGYSARAHIDGKYRVVPALMARDAAIGGFGWSNLFISDIHGSAVRFSVVTTDLEFKKENAEPADYLSFCSYCRKCARHCPSKAISSHNIERLNGDRCFAYWNAAGTDCGVCLAVCPMNHPWGFVKKLALKSQIAAVLLPVMDDLLFGKGKRSPKMPEWMACN